MKNLVYLFTFLFLLTFISCGDKESSAGSEEEISSELKKKASEKVEDLTGMSSEDINNISSENVTKKYPFKSGIITFEKNEFGSPSKMMIYFDNYGIKERNETYNSDGKLEEIRFTDGEKMYLITYKYSSDKIAYIMGPGFSGTEMKFVAEPFTRDEDIQKYGYKKLPNIQVIGKDCEAYITTNSMGEVTFAGWNNILLYSKTKMKMGEFVTQAVNFQENANVEAGLFKVPDGYEVKKM